MNDQELRAQLYDALMRSDSLLSLLYYRGKQCIPWGELVGRDHVQEVISQSRAALKAAEHQRQAERQRAPEAPT